VKVGDRVKLKNINAGWNGIIVIVKKHLYNDVWLCSTVNGRYANLEVNLSEMEPLTPLEELL
jgi:hypothetical protein